MYKNASSTSLGTSASFSSFITSWSQTQSGFRNCASADGLNSNSSLNTQLSSIDRVLAVKQAVGNGDPGAAFVIKIANTIGKYSFQLGFKIQSLDVAATKTTEWKVEYAIGNNPTIFLPAHYTSPLYITTGGGSFTKLNVGAGFNYALNNQSDPVWIRIVALTNSTGSGIHPFTGIDDISLTWTNTAPPVFKPTLLSFSPKDESTLVPIDTKLVLINLFHLKPQIVVSNRS